MRQFSISRLMVVVAVLAGNFAAVRFLMGFSGAEPRLRTLLVGLLPLVDCVILSLASWVTRYRIRLRVRPREERRVLLPLFSLISGVFLLMAIASSLLATDIVYRFAGLVGATILSCLDSLKIEIKMNDDVFIYNVVSLLFGLVLSGPPIVTALVLSFGISRFSLEITPRVSLDAADHA